MYNQVRARWASGDDLSDLSLSPIAHEHPVARALLKPRAPVSFSYGPLPLYELCQLALIWAISGHRQEADELASAIFYLVQKFPLFGSKENQYAEKEAEISSKLFLKACGVPIECEQPRDPFFIALATQLPELKITPKAPVFGWGLYERGDLSMLLALSGQGAPMGALRSGKVEIRAFGPSVPPLCDPSRFGIQRDFEGKDLFGWTSVFAEPHIWVQAETEVQQRQCRLDLRWVGLKSEHPVFFSFYIKAESASIQKQIFKPKSLNRYQGNDQIFSFHSGDCELVLQTAGPLNAQLIPLAGQGAFWNTDFLLAFEIRPVENQTRFVFLQK